MNKHVPVTPPKTWVKPRDEQTRTRNPTKNMG